MAHPNCDQRREAVEKVLSAGISIGGREAKILSVLFGCSVSAIRSDAKVIRAFGPTGGGGTYKSALMSNYIVVDNETNGLLYSMVLMAEIRRKKEGQWAKIYRIPAEAWIAFLQVRYAKVLEVQAYLQAVDRGEGINPDKGAMLEAIDQRCEIPEEELRHGLELYGEEGRQWLADADNQSADDEGEAWKKG